MTALVRRAREQGALVVLPWTVLAETLHGRGKRQREVAASHFELAPLTEWHYRTAAALIDATRMGGHTVDALVAAAARTCERPVLIATSDRKDLARLLRGEPDVHIAVV
jgi:hypothetical protein